MRLTQYNISNGDVVFSKATEAKAVSEVILGGISCLLTCAWWVLNLRNYVKIWMSKKG